jgi:hypothetical protein
MIVEALPAPCNVMDFMMLRGLDHDTAHGGSTTVSPFEAELIAALTEDTIQSAVLMVAAFKTGE